MSLRMAKATRRQGSSFEQSRNRIPADLRSRAPGARFVVDFPAMNNDQAETVPVTVGKAEVVFSLRTRDPVIGKARKALANAALEGLWTALRRDTPTTLSTRDAAALGGDIYNDILAALQDNPEIARGMFYHAPDPSLYIASPTPPVDVAYAPHETEVGAFSAAVMAKHSLVNVDAASRVNAGAILQRRDHLAGMLALADHQRRLLSVEVVERDAADFVLTHGSGDGELYDASEGCDLPWIGIGRRNDFRQLVLGRSPVPFGRFRDEPQSVQRDAGEPDLFGRHGNAMDGCRMFQDCADEADVNDAPPAGSARHRLPRSEGRAINGQFQEIVAEVVVTGRRLGLHPRGLIPADGRNLHTGQGAALDPGGPEAADSTGPQQAQNREGEDVFRAPGSRGLLSLMGWVHSASIHFGFPLGIRWCVQVMQVMRRAQVGGQGEGSMLTHDGEL